MSDHDEKGYITVAGLIKLLKLMPQYAVVARYDSCCENASVYRAVGKVTFDPNHQFVFGGNTTEAVIFEDGLEAGSAQKTESMDEVFARHGWDPIQNMPGLYKSRDTGQIGNIRFICPFHFVLSCKTPGCRYAERG